MAIPTGFSGREDNLKFFKKALAFYFASDILRAPRHPQGWQDSMFADR
jgi:hypothetical protein